MTHARILTLIVNERCFSFRSPLTPARALIPDETRDGQVTLSNQPLAVDELLVSAALVGVRTEFGTYGNLFSSTGKFAAAQSLIPNQTGLTNLVPPYVVVKYLKLVGIIAVRPMGI